MKLLKEMDIVSIVSSLFAMFYEYINVWLRRAMQLLITKKTKSPVTNEKSAMEKVTEALKKSSTQTVVLFDKVSGLRTVLTANPYNVEHVLTTAFHNYPKGPQFRYILGDVLGTGIFTSDGDAWRHQRKLACHHFSVRCLRDTGISSSSHVTHRTISELEDAYRTKRCVDLQDVFQRFEMENVCMALFGVDPRVLTSAGGFTEAFDVATELSARRVVDSTWKIKRFFNVGTERRLRDSVRTVRVFADEIINYHTQESQRQGEDSQSQRKANMLTSFMEACDNVEELKDMIVNMVLAGRDTTASALTSLFWLLSCHPRVEERLLSEINGISENFSYDDLQKMNYLHATLCETMRLYPPVPFDSKHAVHDDVLPDGTTVKAGDRVTYHQFAMGRMPSIWGDDCLEFTPERWLEEDGTVKRVSVYEYPVFQGGMRMCLGKDMALVHMKYAVASVLSEFSFRPSEEWVRPKWVHCLTSRMQHGFPVHVCRRTSC